MVENEIIQAESTKIVRIKPKKGQLRGKFVFESNRQWTDYTTTVIVEFSTDNTAHLPITNGNKHPLTINKLHILGTIEEISEGRIHEIEPTLDNILLLQYANMEYERRQRDEEHNKDSDNIQINTLEEKEYTLETGMNEENKVIRMITSVTNPGSTERMYLLAKHYILDKLGNKEHKQTINNLTTEENLDTMTEEKYEEYLERIEIRNISKEDRKKYVKQIIDRFINKEKVNQKVGKILEKHFECIAVNSIDLGHFDMFKIVLSPD